MYGVRRGTAACYKTDPGPATTRSRIGVVMHLPLLCFFLLPMLAHDPAGVSDDDDDGGRNGSVRRQLVPAGFLLGKEGRMVLQCTLVRVSGGGWGLGDGGVYTNKGWSFSWFGGGNEWWEMTAVQGWWDFRDTYLGRGVAGIVVSSKGFSRCHCSLEGLG